ncbi:hypothetical protein ES705_02516 [subsurface metagenome]
MRGVYLEHPFPLFNRLVKFSFSIVVYPPKITLLYSFPKFSRFFFLLYRSYLLSGSDNELSSFPVLGIKFYDFFHLFNCFINLPFIVIGQAIAIQNLSFFKCFFFLPSIPGNFDKFGNLFV